ncbi:hypothetical protein E2R51_15165 [Jeotgalibacillus sp. S-D1]|uniref:S41 family peptidase n=1 Tax=Jeotgalibacillus sp. S-D1 TaxID=2552189 RepID=UPI00105AA7BF|nr:S41 family peptidase [Jeotgalibacillus sp. S-D1]TDL31129.1 hypothetical protein E2R51_15165 [Jeotgalibacillus sp. S-D1]
MKRLKKILKILLVISLLWSTVSIVSYFYWENQNENSQKRTSIKQEQQVFTKEEVITDLREYKEKLESVHPNPYHTITEKEFDQLMENEIARLTDEIDRKELFLVLSRLSHSLMDEHVTVDFPEEFKTKMIKANTKVLPLKVEIINNRIFIQTDLTHQIPQSSELISLNGTLSEKLAEKVLNLKSGRSEKQIAAYSSDSFSELTYMLYGSSSSNKIQYKTNGETKTIDVEGMDYEDYLEEKALINAYTISDDGKTAFFTFDEFDDIHTENKLEDTIDQLFSDIKQQGTANLIIDMRNNLGGNSKYGDQLLKYISDKDFSQMTSSVMKVSDTSRQEIMNYIPAFIRWMHLQYVIPMLRPLYTQELGSTFTIDFDMISPYPKSERFNGDVTLLISERTMSSASLFAGTFRELQIGAIEGTATGGYPEHYGNVSSIYLSESGMAVQMPTSINYGVGGSQPVMPNQND